MPAVAVQQRFSNIRAVAAELGVSTETVRQWLVDGRLTAYRPGGRQILIRRDELEQFLEASTKIKCVPPWLQEKSVP